MKTLKESILTSIGQGDRYFEELYKKYGLDPKKVTWNKDGSIDYDGDVDFSFQNITEIPIKFNEISGMFNCMGTNITSLEGCPKSCKHFICSHCKLLKSLEGGPKEVMSSYCCDNCVNIPSLKGAPKEVENFECRYCIKLKNLKGGPKQVGGRYMCLACPKLTSLEGAPKEVGHDFDCRFCENLHSLKGGPKMVGNDYWCSECGGNFTEEDVRNVCNVKNKIIVD